MKRDDELNRLLDEYTAMVESEENRKRKIYWEFPMPVANYQHRAVPLQPVSRENPKVPYRVFLMNSTYGRLLGFSVKDYYTDPVVFLKNLLKERLHHFRTFDDDTYFTMEIPIWLGPPFEPSMFGAEVLYSDEQEPWLGTTPVLRTREELTRLSYPDFHKSGLMPVAHRMYEGVRELIEGYGRGYEVLFPDWIRGPFMIASHLRGIQEILIDLMEDPEWVRTLLGFITEGRKRWVAERARFLGTGIGGGDLFNDEVNSPSISPRLYREVILGVEHETASFHGSIGYWHSCGNITGFLDDILTIPNLRSMNASAWSDQELVLEKCRERGVAVELATNSPVDILNADEERMRSSIVRLVDMARLAGARAYIRVGGLQQFHSSVEDDVAKVRRWTQLARAISEV